MTALTLPNIPIAESLEVTSAGAYIMTDRGVIGMVQSFSDNIEREVFKSYELGLVTKPERQSTYNPVEVVAGNVTVGDIDFERFELWAADTMSYFGIDVSTDGAVYSLSQQLGKIALYRVFQAPDGAKKAVVVRGFLSSIGRSYATEGDRRIRTNGRFSGETPYVVTL